MKDITFGFVLSMLLTTLMFGMSLSLFAQGENPPTVIKKEIKIKKIIDEDGNETTETIETEVEVNAEDWEDIEGEFDIDIDETIENGIKKRIVRVQAGGENGELPQDILDELESLGIDINIIEGSEKRTIIIDSDEEGAEKSGHDIRIFKMDSDEKMPEDIRKKLEEHNIDLDEMKEGGQGIRMYKTQKNLDEADMRIGFRRMENSDFIDRQTKILRIASIDDLDNEIINEIAEMGVSKTELRQRFDAAENTVRISKEGLQPVEIEVDAPMTQQQMFFMGDDEKVVEIDPNMNFEWIEKKMDMKTEKLEMQKEKLEERLQERTKRIQSMVDKMSEERQRAYLGIRMQDTENGVIILHVAEDSPAQKAGLKKDDKVTTLNGIAVKDTYTIVTEIQEMKPDDALEIGYTRGGEAMTANAKLGKVGEPMSHDEKMSMQESLMRGWHIDRPLDFGDAEEKKRWKMQRMKERCERLCNMPFLGIAMEMDDQNRVRLRKIVEGTGAEAAGLQADDILLKINKVSLDNIGAVFSEISKYAPGDVVLVQVKRGNKKRRIKATLGNKSQNNKQDHHCDCETGEINKEAVSLHEIIIIKENAADIPQINIDTDNTLNLDEIDLFPNPNNGTFTIRFVTESKTPTTVSVIDVTGKEAYREVIQDFNGRYDNKIDISNQAKGTYFLNIIQGDKVYTEQFVVGTK